METTGFVVETDVCRIKFYTSDQGIQLRNKSELMNHRPGEWFRISAAEAQDYEKCEPLHDLSHFKTRDQNGTCYVELFAAKPNYSKLSENLRNKYEGAVWSPFLLYLNDEERILENVQQEVVKVTVKYAPSDDKLFEIVSFSEWDKQPNEARLRMYYHTPWSIEAFASRMKPSRYLEFRNGFVAPKRTVNRETEAIGICIANKAPNPVQQYCTSARSSTSYLWSQYTGLTRWIIQAETGDRASSLKVSFPFEKEKIEGQTTQGIKYVKYNAHFHDVELGRVEIHQFEGEFILQKINNHHEDLLKKGEAEVERAQKEVVIIDATVTVDDKFVEIFENHLKKGIFFVKSIDRMYYLNEGQTIYQKE
ncbi:hypothetical protein CAEBREN_02829 [Caenorhabditis brenneri]|uniref:Uncharacterized protein n=1 Tax=Caenorhabditis brenneri TaxID=135651 RepID=G0NZK5_CAEBE|nr:hypothetical protein CAEBREN_02829 [Caenorhabditis brenneri]